MRKKQKSKKKACSVNFLRFRLWMQKESNVAVQSRLGGTKERNQEKLNLPHRHTHSKIEGEKKKKTT